MKKIYAYQIAEGIDIKNFKKNYIGKEYYSNVFESFYVNENDKYLYVLSYGVIVFSGYDEIKISEFLDFIKPWCKDILSEKTWDEFAVYDNSPEDKFGYNEIYLVKNNPDIMRIIMLNAGQSAALDYFSNLAQILMDQTNGHTRELEIKGKLNINNKKLLKFIGRTMNIKNGIVDNLYIIDSPDVTWEDEYLNKIDTGLKNTFDLKDRFRDIDSQLQIVKENLELFKDLMQHRKSNMLEWIIISLFIFEILQLLVEKFFSKLF